MLRGRPSPPRPLLTLSLSGHAGPFQAWPETLLTSLRPSCPLSYAPLALRPLERSRNVRGPHFSPRPTARSSQPSCELSPSALPRTRPRSNSARGAGVGPQQAFLGRASTAVCDTLSLPEHGAHRRTRAKTAMRPILATPMGRWVKEDGTSGLGPQRGLRPGPRLLPHPCSLHTHEGRCGEWPPF